MVVFNLSDRVYLCLESADSYLIKMSQSEHTSNVSDKQCKKCKT